MAPSITINRAPVLTRWAAEVAERLGYTRDEARTLGRSVAGMNAQSKAVHLGLREPAALAAKFPREELAARAFTLYEAFRPGIPASARGWGAKGVLDLDVLAKLAPQGRKRG